LWLAVFCLPIERARVSVGVVRRRPLHLAVLIFQALWLNVIVPGHTRGIVQLPGSNHCSTVNSCPLCANEHPAGSKDAPANRSSNCAICFFAAHLNVPPTIDLSLTRLDFLHRLSAIIAEDRIARIVISPFDCRGPPAIV